MCKAKWAEEWAEEWAEKQGSRLPQPVFVLNHKNHKWTSPYEDWFEKYWYVAIALGYGTVCIFMAKNYIILTHTRSPARRNLNHVNRQQLPAPKIFHKQVQIMEALNDTKVDRNFPWPAI